MGRLLQRHLQKRFTRDIERRWASVSPVIGADEYRVEHTAAFYLLPGGRLGSYLLLTSAALVVSVVEGAASEANPAISGYL